MANETNYYQYEDASSVDALKFIDETIDSINLPDASIARLSPRSFRVSYSEPELGDFCHYDISLRASNSRSETTKGHFSVKLNLTLADGTVAGSRRFKDITAESLTAIIQGMYKEVKKSRSLSMGELEEFRKIVTDDLTSQGYSCIGISPYSMAFRGNNKNVSITISELGRFRAIIRLTRKKDGVRRAFETGAAVSRENALALVNRIKSL